MTLHRMKQVFVDEKKLMTHLQMNVLVAKVGAAIIGSCLDVVLLTYSMFGMALTVVVVFAAMFAFNWVFDMLREDEASLKGIKTFGNLFFVFYILIVVEFLVLKYLRFF